MHTPGPWLSFYKAKYDEWHVSLPVADSSFKLALAPDGIQSLNREDDAHLIAAAPDLLNELGVREGDLVMLRKAIEAGDPKAEVFVRIDDMLRETRAVIALAKHGRAS